ncbi:MAG TPA: glycosyltransferase [Blastocatellia bacterium]|nr:glycosyltransferase [Blastocatellia bacterium]
MSENYDITAVISTYNRSEMLPAALDSVLTQEGCNYRYEVVVVDNNSSDSTRDVVESYIARGHSNLRYVFEPNQGSSYARNAGVAASRSETLAFADDDVRVAKNWISTIKRAFDEHPKVDCVGGKVLPVWATPAPAWFTREHWAPLALQDYGDGLLSINLNNRLCLVSANLAFRRRALVDIGLFAPELQRIKDGIGSMEDAELLERYWQTGRECLYLPDLIVETDVAPERLTKTYHKRWHLGHGYFYAIKRSDDLERGYARLFDVPAHLYKRAVIDAAKWLLFCLVDPRRAFAYQIRLSFFWGFFRKRRADYRATSYRGLSREFINFLRSFAQKIHLIKPGPLAVETGPIVNRNKVA